MNSQAGEMKNGAKMRRFSIGKQSGLMVIDLLPEFLACLEMRHMLGRHFHLLAGFGISPHPGGAVIQAETAKSAYLDAPARRQGLDHGVEYGFHGQLGVRTLKLRVPDGKPCDEFGFGHSAQGFLSNQLIADQGSFQSAYC
jgi:hypothetical protein